MTSASISPSWIAVCVVAASSLPSLSLSAADVPVIRFDLPPLAAARIISPADESLRVSDVMPDEMLVECELNLSSMIATPRSPQIDQWLVVCQPRDEAMMIADYQPRTEVASDLEGPIQVKMMDEASESFGISMDAAYGHLARGRAGADRGKKNSESQQYNRLAPVQAVTASGTIHRGRGVYFKLRWTAVQVLEGEKQFRLMFRVPADWRSGLLDVSVTAQSQSRSLGSWDRGVKTLGAANFVVAAYRIGDPQAAQAAKTLAEAEQKLRLLAAHRPPKSSLDSIPSMLRHVAMKLDWESQTPPMTPWVDRLLLGGADPYLDKQMSRLPVDVRVAALDYCEARDNFIRLK